MIRTGDALYRRLQRGVRILGRPKLFGLPLLPLAVLGGIIASLLLEVVLVRTAPSGQISRFAAYPSARLTASEQHDNGLLLLPPPLGAQPAVSAMEAVAVADQDGVPGAASVQVLLATYEDPNLQTHPSPTRHGGEAGPRVGPAIPSSSGAGPAAVSSRSLPASVSGRSPQ